VLRFNSSA